MIQAFRGDFWVTTEFSGGAEIDEGDCLTRISRVPGCCRSAKARDFIRLEGQRPSSGRRQGHIGIKKPSLQRDGGILQAWEGYRHLPSIVMTVRKLTRGV